MNENDWNNLCGQGGSMQENIDLTSDCAKLVIKMFIDGVVGLDDAVDEFKDLLVNLKQLNQE